MTPASLLAAGAGIAGVLGAWECLAAAEGRRIAERISRLVEPLTRARREGRAPTDTERRRLGLLAAGCLLAAGWLVGGPVAGAAAALAGPALSIALVRAHRARYRAELGRGAASAARAVADAVGAGHSVRGAIAAVAPATAGAAGHELRRAAHSLALGEPTDAVLERLRIRAGSAAWDTLVAAILLQRDAGGDLAGLLRELAAALEAAERADRDARAATAQARFTAWLILALPLGAAFLTELAAPGFVARLLASPLSATLAALALVLQVTSVAAIHRLAR